MLIARAQPVGRAIFIQRRLQINLAQAPDFIVRANFNEATAAVLRDAGF